MHFFIERALFTLLLVVVRTIVEKVLLLKILSKNASPPHNLGFCKPCLYPFLGHPSRDQYITSKYYKNKIPFETKNCKFRFTPFLNNENAFYPCIIHPSWCRGVVYLSRDKYITSKNYKNKIPFETKNYKFRFTPFLNNENAFYPCIIQPSWYRDPIPAVNLSRDQYITSKKYKNKVLFETKNYRFKFTLFLN